MSQSMCARFAWIAGSALFMGAPTTAVATDLLVADGTSHVIRRYAGDGTPKGVFASGGLEGRTALAFGPDGFLYVSDSQNNTVQKYNPVTGEHLGAFVSAGSGGMVDARGLTFGPDGRLYIANAQTLAKILRYDGSDGSYVGVFAGAPPVPRSPLFGADGNLYVACELCHDVVRFNGQTGATMGRFVDSGTSGPLRPYGMAWGPDGHLYLSSARANETIRRYDGSTGLLIDDFAVSSLILDPISVAFSADGTVLYVAGQTSNNVVAFDGVTGAFLAEVVPSGSAGLGQVWGIAVLPCLADHDGTGFVDTDDFDAFVYDFTDGVESADFDRSGFVDTDDFDAFVRAFEEGC
ncbi:MAG: NHL repeat-containing protein [Phycisphaeraceae bacterium]|nr:NHL repeat-containing protein [Phycisphaerae bacterium]MBX3392336.1 NHL repeat-containing protein [Phycisphaeraceae bacterium]HRJ50484.1 NHL repeat-containing protein [Phycisphaerales bacterium]